MTNRAACGTNGRIDWRGAIKSRLAASFHHIAGMLEKFTMSTSLLTFAITDTGLARRRNEDCFLVASAERDSTIVASKTAAVTASIEGGDRTIGLCVMRSDVLNSFHFHRQALNTNS